MKPGRLAYSYSWPATCHVPVACVLGLSTGRRSDVCERNMAREDAEALIAVVFSAVVCTCG